MRNVLRSRHAIKVVVLIWACWIISVAVLRVTEAEVITQIGTAGATVITGVIGILTTVIGFYQWRRRKDDDAGSG